MKRGATIGHNKASMRPLGPPLFFTLPPRLALEGASESFEREVMNKLPHFPTGSHGPLPRVRVATYDKRRNLWEKNWAGWQP